MGIVGTTVPRRLGVCVLGAVAVLALLPPARGDAAANEFAPATSPWNFHGAKRAVVIRWKAAGDATFNTNSAASWRALMTDGSNSLAAMWHAESRGDLTLTADIVDESVPTGLTPDCDNFATIGQTLAARHPGYDFYLFAGGVCSQAAAVGQVQGGLSWYFGPITERELWHEMGHNLGFGHAGALVQCTDINGDHTALSGTCVADEFADDYNAMGADDGACAYSGYHAVGAGWPLPWRQVNNTATVAVRARNLPDNGTPRALVVPGAPSQWGTHYWLEWRTTDYASCDSAGDRGLQIRIVRSGPPGQDTFLVNTGADEVAIDTNDAALDVGETFRDPYTNTTITLVDQNYATGVATVRVKYNDPVPPTPPLPTTAQVVGGVLRITGDHTTDHFDVRDTTGGVLVTNTRAVRTGSGCTPVSPTSARCTGMTKTFIALGNGHDHVTVDSMLPTDIDGGAQGATYHASATRDGPTRLVDGTVTTADYSARSVALSLTADGAANDGVKGEKDNIGRKVAVIVGGRGADRILGPLGKLGAHLIGGDGNDKIDGRNEYDYVEGGAGNDTLRTGAGDDRIEGGDGNDTIVPGAGRDDVDAGAGNDTINAKDRHDDRVWCGPGADKVTADRANPKPKANAQWVVGDRVYDGETVKY